MPVEFTCLKMKKPKKYFYKHTDRLKSIGVKEVHSKIFDVNQSLSIITKGPVG